MLTSKLLATVAHEHLHGHSKKQEEAEVALCDSFPATLEEVVDNEPGFIQIHSSTNNSILFHSYRNVKKTIFGCRGSYVSITAECRDNVEHSRVHSKLSYVYAPPVKPCICFITSILI